MKPLRVAWAAALPSAASFCTRSTVGSSQSAFTASASSPEPVPCKPRSNRVRDSRKPQGVDHLNRRRCGLLWLWLLCRLRLLLLLLPWLKPHVVSPLVVLSQPPVLEGPHRQH